MAKSSNLSPRRKNEFRYETIRSLVFSEHDDRNAMWNSRYNAMYAVDGKELELIAKEEE
jgi:hypothetical protein